jgi:hypothetical protein
LCRYAEELEACKAEAARMKEEYDVGLYKLNAADP